MPPPSPLIGRNIAKWCYERPFLRKLLVPMAQRYVQNSGYRQMGLKQDDLINEENEMVIQAIKRLSQREQYDRIFRIRRAVQLSIQARILPKDQWIKPEEDTPYLTLILEQLEAEAKERELLDNMTVVRKH